MVVLFQWWVFIPEPKLTRPVRHRAPNCTRPSGRGRAAKRNRAHVLTEHDTISRRVDDFNRHLDAALAPYAEQLRLLETLPGIDHTAACAILSEIGADPYRVFGNAHRLAAWAGLCPGNNESAGKRRTGRTRRGNQTLRAVLIECAHAAGAFPISRNSV